MGVPVGLPYVGTDLVVPVSSALLGSKETNKGGGTKEISCLAPHPYPNPVINPADCEHGNLVKDDGVKKHVVDGIKAYLKSFKGPTLNFNGMKLELPAGWKVTGQKHDEWQISGDCPGGKCKTFTLLGSSNLHTDFCANCLKTAPSKWVRARLSTCAHSAATAHCMFGLQVTSRW